MKGYKGFNKDMTCRGFQYEEGKSYEHDGDVKVCSSGFHACEDALEVLSYYAPSSSVYHEVELEDVTRDANQNDSKVASRKITIGAQLSIAKLVKASIDFRMKRAVLQKDSHTTGYRGAASAMGDRGAASATGERGAASATGYRGAASATGYSGTASATGERGAASATGYRGAASATGYSGAASATGERGAASATRKAGAASATGDRGAASATGDRGAASATGYSGAASATGERGAASATGYRGAASATGERGAASATGKAGVAIAAGLECKAMGALGCALFLVEREWDDVQSIYAIINVAAVIVDGKRIKPDTWYTLVDGKIKEVAQ